MKHVGDITALSGSTLPPVDVIIGGSPCQDLSIAGNRDGLSGERSGLFMEQVRIIREMREVSKQDGRTNEFIRPRFAVWENVPGAFSSNKGRDFQTVLSEFVRIAEPDAPDVPMPNKGRWPHAGLLMGDGWSLAWRLLDAQYWGVPQRRKRIALVADFGGQRAGEILFERTGVEGNQDTGGAETEATPASSGSGNRLSDSVDGAGAARAYPAVVRTISDGMDGVPLINDQGGSAINFDDCAALSPTLRAETHGNLPAVLCLTPWDPQSERIFDACGIYPALQANSGGGQNRSAVLAIPINSMLATRCKALGERTGLGIAENGDPQFTLSTQHHHAVCTFAIHQNQAGEVRMGDVAYTLNTNSNATGRNAPLVFDARGNGDGKIVPTITGDHENRTTDYTALLLSMKGYGDYAISSTARTCRAAHDINTGDLVISFPVVRRLTPVECERLQGYPDNWTDIGDYIDTNGKTRKTSDSARYKALGNSIALPCWDFILRGISAQYDRPATLGSLFDGIGGYPLLWERINGTGTALWASEIEEFPIAVTKRHFPE